MDYVFIVTNNDLFCCGGLYTTYTRRTQILPCAAEFEQITVQGDRTERGYGKVGGAT